MRPHSCYLLNLKLHLIFSTFLTSYKCLQRVHASPCVGRVYMPSVCRFIHCSPCSHCVTGPCMHFQSVNFMVVGVGVLST